MMIKPWQSPHWPFFLTIAMLCATGMVCAQEKIAGPHGHLASLDHKHASALVSVQSPPEYPPVAKVNLIQGRVMLELTVNARGNLKSAHVLEGNALLAQSALEAARGWRYRPLSTRSGPAGFTTIVIVKFSLHEDSEGVTELTPQQAERDFLRQVKPPQVTRPAEGERPDDVVHMRLLVSDQGRVLDMNAPPVAKTQLVSANETLRGWTFRPAYWGNLPVASYLDVDVPVAASSVAQVAVVSGGR